MYCSNCGNMNPDNAKFCSKCGVSISGQGPPLPSYTQTLTSPPPPRQYQPPGQIQSKHGGAGKTIAIVAVAVVVLLIIIVAAMNLSSVTGSSATISVTIHSTHILNTVSYSLYVDSALKASGSLSALATVTKTITFHWESSDAVTVVVSATSSGGGVGSQSDQQTLTLSPGGSYAVNLYI